MGLWWYFWLVILGDAIRISVEIVWLGKKWLLRKCENKLFPTPLFVFTTIVIEFMWGTFKKYVFLKYLLICGVCDFALEHLTISRFRGANSYSVSLSNSGFLEMFEVNKLVNKVKDPVQFCNQFLWGHYFFYSLPWVIWLFEIDFCCGNTVLVFMPFQPPMGLSFVELFM